MKRIAIALLVLLAGCQTAPDQRDPAVYRPKTPIAYPQPR